MLTRAHAADVLVQAAEGQRVPGAADDVARRFQPVEARLGHLGGELGIGDDLGHAAHRLAGGPPENRVAAHQGALCAMDGRFDFCLFHRIIGCVCLEGVGEF